MDKNVVIARLKHNEQADYDYSKFRYDMFKKSVDAGRKRGGCSKCGGEKFLPILKKSPSVLMLEGEEIKYTSWSFAVSICPCVGIVKNSEDMSEEEARAVFG